MRHECTWPSPLHADVIVSHVLLHVTNSPSSSSFYPANRLPFYVHTPEPEAMAAAMRARCLLWAVTILQCLGTLFARGGGRGRGLNRIGGQGQVGIGKKEQSLFTPEIIVYILVIIVFFLLFVCICLFKEPEPGDYLNKKEKQKQKQEQRLREQGDVEAEYPLAKTQIL